MRHHRSWRARRGRRRHDAAHRARASGQACFGFPLGYGQGHDFGCKASRRHGEAAQRDWQPEAARARTSWIQIKDTRAPLYRGFVRMPEHHGGKASLRGVDREMRQIVQHQDLMRAGRDHGAFRQCGSPGFGIDIATDGNNGSNAVQLLEN